MTFAGYGASALQSGKRIAEGKGTETGLRFLDVKTKLWPSEEEIAKAGQEPAPQAPPAKKSFFSSFGSSNGKSTAGHQLVGKHEWPFEIQIPSETTAGAIDYRESDKLWPLPPSFALKYESIFVNYEIMLDFLGAGTMSQDVG